jgi:hypothetical protein
LADLIADHVYHGISAHLTAQPTLASDDAPLLCRVLKRQARQRKIHSASSA